MTDLLLHAKTRERMQAIVQRAPQGLLITGEAGSGKDTIARHLLADILGFSPEEVGSYPYLHIIDPADPYIKIEEIRGLQQFLKLKVPKRGGINRIVIIARAERMRHEAQNALLKTLEEPPAGTMLILTVETSERLLPTIVSRCQELAVLPVSLKQAENYFRNKGLSGVKIAGAHALSMGQAGLMSALLSETSHPLKEQVELAKSILSQPVGERLLRGDVLAQDKASTAILLSALRRIAHAGLSAASRQGKQTAVSQWHNRQAAILQARQDFDRNANSKLLLTDLFVRL